MISEWNTAHNLVYFLSNSIICLEKAVILHLVCYQSLRMVCVVVYMYVVISDMLVYVICVRVFLHVCMAYMTLHSQVIRVRRVGERGVSRLVPVQGPMGRG